MPITNLVVLMLENRSFDHMLGYMASAMYPIDGLTGAEFNYPDPLTKKLPRVSVSGDAPYVPDLDPSPGHNVPNVAVQLYGADPRPDPSVGVNIGFVADYLSIVGPVKGSQVMRCFGDGRLPALQTLAREFAICDHWYSSMPGPTWPNRFFAHCATSGGFIDDQMRDYRMRTIYQNLSDANVNWRVYYHDLPQSMALANQWQYFSSKYELFDQAFARDAAAGLLPRYSFIEPRYYTHLGSRANDQHPDNGIPEGELLIKQVYELLRASPQWPQSMLIIAWDEHGGFFDHEEPRAAVPPDDQISNFNFASYGLRVPAVIVSPLIPKATISHDLFDHASIPATVKVLFNLPGFLTKRDAAANNLLGLASLAAAREDAPSTLPSLPGTLQSALVPPPVSTKPPNDLQLSLLQMARSLDPTAPAEAPLAAMPQTEEDAASEARAHFLRFAATQ
jgi:phospholipase C